MIHNNCLKYQRQMRKMPAIKRLLVMTILLSLCLNTLQREIFIDYGVGGEGKELMKYFFDVEDAFYVDVGAYDPIFASNTLNLYTMGWGGINIDANPDRLARFFMQRPDQTNLNFAIGDNDTFVTLYEVDEDSSSTVSPKVKDFISSFKPVLQEIKIPSLSLKQVCERYYYRKPIFMNLDIEGYGSQALLSNQWSNPLCVPEVIFSEINQETRQSGLPLPQQILLKHGYKKQPVVVGLNQIYIHSTVAAKYQQKAKKAAEYLNKIQEQSINMIVGALSRYLKTPTQLFKHYEPTTDQMFHKFTKINEVIDLNHLNQVSNQLSVLQDRPIGIYHFNPLRNALVLSEGKFTATNIKVQNYEFFEIEVEKPNGKKFRVQIFDHNYENVNGKKPSVILTAKSAYFLEESKQFTPVSATPVVNSQNLTKEQKEQQNLLQKLLAEFTKQITKQENILAKIDSTSGKQTEYLKETFISLQNVEISFLQRINARMSDFDGNQPQKGTVLNQHKEASMGKILDSLNLDIKNLMIIQNITLGLILLMSISICLSACLMKRKKKAKYSSIQTGHESSAINIEK